MKTKLFKIYFMATIGMALFFTLGCEKDDPVEFAGGIGTGAEPYLIETPKQLDAVRHNLNKHFKQIADIDLSGYSSGEGWQSIGYENDPFTGTYDGDGYKITNLTINYKSKSPWIGLFGYTDNSTIKNLGLELINVSVQLGRAGGLVGENRGNIINCYATGEVSSPGSQGVGGLVYWNDGNITNSYAAVNVSGAWVVGGLVGTNYDNGEITDCYATGDASATGTTVGGLVGGNDGNITNCFATGDVSGNEDVGGLVGVNYRGNIKDSYVTGDVSGSKYVGGLVGWSWDYITNCNATGNVSGGDIVGGLVGGFQGGHLTNCYATGIVLGNNVVGGLVGVNVNSNIINSFATGDVSGENQVGGLAGLNTEEGNITNCYATGDVAGEDRIGGLVGSNGEQYYEGFIKNSYATGVVSGNNDVGGLVGEYLSGNIEYSYYDKETTGQDDTGKGIPKTIAEMMQQSTFETWDFTNIWKINEGIGYPYLRWQVG